MKRLLRIHLLIISVFVVTCIAATSGVAQEKAISLKIANWFPVGHKQDVLLKQWGQELEKRSGGKVKASYYAAGTLVPAAQSYDAVVKGIADVSNQVLGYAMGRFPFMQVLDLPIGFPSGPAPTKIANAVYNKFKPKELEEVKVLWLHSMPDGLLHTRDKPVRKLEDVQGLRIRCFGSNAKFVGLVGAAPVAIPAPDVYDALSKGVLDGMVWSYEALKGFRVGEHIKFTTENSNTAYGAVFVVCMNKKKWASLPPDVQKVVDDMSQEYIEKYGQMWADINAEGKDWLRERGVEFISLSPEEQIRWYEKGSKPVAEAYLKEMKEKGLPGEEAMTFLEELFKEYKK
jgi:TRAP-type C4-dicarboxylate transport system substrate-binding protein